METWKPVAGYRGYEVSDAGRVKSPRKILMPVFVRGYPCVRLGGRSPLFTVHKLVLLSFVGPRPAGMVARHLDDVKTNNRLANLCWGTKRENALDGLHNGGMLRLTGERSNLAKISDGQAAMLRGKPAAVTNRLAERLGISRGHARRIARRDARKWQAEQAEIG